MLLMSDPDRSSAMGTAALNRSRLYTWRAVAERIAIALRLRRNAGVNLVEAL
jgi:hypothetical protein